MSGPFRRYMCLKCGYTYDRDKGDAPGGLEPGRDLSTAPPEWRCPRCGADQDAFAGRADDDDGF